MRTPAQQEKSAHWSYEGEEGPKEWGDIDPSYATCKIGRKQSPIDIRGATKADLPAIQFDYQPSPLKVVDNGHTITVSYAPGSIITVGDHKYQLLQFHFHPPSQELINGKHYDMVVHLVHADADGKLAVVAVLLKTGSANAALQTVWDHLPAEKGQENAGEGISTNAADLLPV